MPAFSGFQSAPYERPVTVSRIFLSSSVAAPGFSPFRRAMSSCTVWNSFFVIGKNRFAMISSSVSTAGAKTKTIAMPCCVAADWRMPALAAISS